jgi:hypothetical protein
MEETVHDDFFENFTVVTATIFAIDDLSKTSGFLVVNRYSSQGKQAFDEQELIQVWMVYHF